MTDSTQIPVQLAASRRARRTARGFSVALVVSLVFHAGAVGAAIYASRSKPRPKLESAIPVQLVKLGKKRDPKLLPRMVAEPPPPPEEAVKLDTGKEPKPPAENVPKEKTSKSQEPEMSAAARRLLEQSKLDRALKNLDEPEGDPDGDEFGTTTDATNAATGYQRQISRALQAAYRLPEAIPSGQRQFLRARVVLFIEGNGKIASYEFVETHPNTLFMGALESLLKSITLPPPPASEAQRVKDAGVEVIFRP